MTTILYRQGDVALISTTKPTKASRQKPVAAKRITLALGEVTGHAHVIEGAVAEFLIDGRRVLWVEAPSELTHQEHAPITVMPGWYVVQPQREYTPGAIRRVAD